MKTIQEVREMTNEQIMTEMRKLAATLRANTTTETKEFAMYFTVMSQRTNKDPRAKIKEIGYGIYEEAEQEGWF